MAVHQDLVLPLRPTLKDNRVHDLHDMQKLLWRRHLQVLPIEVVVLNTCVHYLLGCVSEASPGNDAISTIGMLSWLLEVYDSDDTLLFELLDDVVLLDESI